jgi:hypothetical protein
MDANTVDALLERKIREHWESVSLSLRLFEKIKKRYGRCRGGISCMAPVENAGGYQCVYHKRMAKELREGAREPLGHTYVSEYGKARKKETEDRKKRDHREGEESISRSVPHPVSRSRVVRRRAA